MSDANEVMPLSQRLLHFLESAQGIADRVMTRVTGVDDFSIETQNHYVSAWGGEYAAPNFDFGWYCIPRPEKLVHRWCRYKSLSVSI